MRHHRNLRNAESGQALVLCVISLFVLGAMFALAIDLGWARFVQKRAQAAVDAAALAAASEAFEAAGLYGGLNCANVSCTGVSDCPSVGNLQTGCEYAEANGFTSGGDAGKQKLKISASAGTAPPGAPSVPVDYWVEVTASHLMPQWFSGFVSPNGLEPGARATAAVREVEVSASMHLLNRKGDCFVAAAGIGLVCGENFLGVGFNDIVAPGGIYMSSSNGSGLGLPNISAGTVLGDVEVESPFTYLMGKGAIAPLLGLASIDWDNSPTNGFPDGDMFTDPMAGKPQPAVPTGLVDRPVPGGVIVGSLLSSNPRVLPPGNYYSTLPVVGGATGLPVTIAGNVIFSDGSNPPCGGFCDYVFYGGVVTASLSSVTFSPGRYVFAGAQPVSGGPGIGLSVGVGARIKDLTPMVNGEIGPNSDAGEIFIFTNKNYPGLQLPAAIAASGLSFPQARAGVTVGVGGTVVLHGLNKSNAALPTALKKYAPVVIWQDRANTTLRYQANGLLDRTCGGICNNILSVPGSQEMVISALRVLGKPGANLYGTVYGPRGSWLTIVGVLPNDVVAGPLQIITGALQMTLNAELDLKLLPNPPTRTVVGLIE